MYIVLFGLVILFILYLFSYRKYSEHFKSSICPDKLTYYKNVYSLWNDDKVIKKFNSYKEYLHDFNSNQFNYYNKNFECTPLVPINNRDIGSILNLKGTKTRLFNLY